MLYPIITETRLIDLNGIWDLKFENEDEKINCSSWII